VFAAAHRPASPRGIAAVLLVAALIAPIFAAPARASGQDRAELSRVQHKLDAIRRVLGDARADADKVARALVQADRDVAEARAALEEAERRYREAQARRKQAVLEAARAKLEVDAQQAVIDRRARATYQGTGMSAMLSLLIEADDLGDLIDRGKLLDNVAKAANAELRALTVAKLAADAARRRAVTAEQQAAAQEERMRARAAELEQVRAARAAARDALRRKIAKLRVRRASLRAASGRIIRKIRAEEAAARRRAAEAAARRARLAASRAGGSGPTVVGDDLPVGPNTASYQRLTPTAKRLYGLVVRIFDVHAIGGWRPYGSVPGSDHPYGRAIDVMVGYPSASGRALGWRIANWAVGNAWALDVKYVIFNGRIWTPSGGWHAYRHPADPCNCNPTLRHDDHVHISVWH
jgi:peptidoglycan hydrolase CwlO-like protein